MWQAAGQNRPRRARDVRFGSCRPPEISSPAKRPTIESTTLHGCAYSRRSGLFAMRPASAGGRKFLSSGIRKCERDQWWPGVAPPSTAMAVPWTCRARSEHRNSASAATSSGLPKRRALLLVSASAPLGVGIAGMNDVDVDVIAIAEFGEALGKVGDRRIDRAADQEFGIGGACGAPDDVDDASLRSLQQRPEQPGEPHATEELQREALEPDRVGQIQERARARRARIVDEHVATLEALVDALEQLLARLELAQIAGDGERLRRDFARRRRPARFAHPRARMRARCRGRSRGSPPK